jgi:hypothetical protein
MPFLSTLAHATTTQPLMHQCTILRHTISTLPHTFIITHLHAATHEKKQTNGDFSVRFLFPNFCTTLCTCPAAIARSTHRHRRPLGLGISLGLLIIALSIVLLPTSCVGGRCLAFSVLFVGTDAGFWLSTTAGTAIATATPAMTPPPCQRCHSMLCCRCCYCWGTHGSEHSR